MPLGKPVFIFLAAVLTLSLLGNVDLTSGRLTEQISGGLSYPEVAQVPQAGFNTVSDFFEKIAEEKGGGYAYEVLKRAELPPNLDLHLLGHAVGDILYKQEGLEGIKVCTPDFRNACSHSIVVGLFFDEGEGALDAIAETCRQAPGGSGAYTMCFHGLGHGILAYTGYDMEKTVALCKKTGTEARNYREYPECVGGSIMEIVGGGFHDPKLWAAQSKKYLPEDKPLALCYADFMPQEARGMCLTYLTPHLFKLAGGSLSSPTPESFAGAFDFCKAIPMTSSSERRACSGGLGKEFVVLAQNRDVRRIDQMNDEQLKKVHAWCALADSPFDIAACTTSSLNSLYWGGENDPGAAIRFCALAAENLQSSCFSELFGGVNYFMRNDRAYKASFCEQVPAARAADCRQVLER